MSDFGADEIRIGHAVERSIAHLAAACELYGMGRKPDALLQAARPITDVLPALETEIRSANEAMGKFFGATAAVGSEIRSNAKPRAVRRALKKAEQASHDLLVGALGEVARAREPDFPSSVGVALLDEALTTYRRAVEQESLSDYHAAYAMADRGTHLIWESYDGRIQDLNQMIRGLNALLPTVEPPEQLPRPETLEELVASITSMAVDQLGAQRVTWTIEDSARRLERLLGEVVDAYDQNLGPLAARLAASLFVRTYDPIRREIATVDADAEARLTSLLGFELRRAINDGADPDAITALATEARELLTTLRNQTAT